MNKRGGLALWVSIILVVLLLLGIFFYFVLYKPNKSYLYTGSAELVNPASNLSLEDAVKDFDERYVTYLLVMIEAYNLHNPPLSSNTPKLEINLEDLTYNAFIEDGEIKVFKGEIDDEDVRIKTTKEEIVSVLKNPVYAQESFSSGKSSMELVSSKSTLFSKGYLNIYTKLTGKSITGSVIRIYSD